MEDSKQQTRPKRVFINDVHRYSSKHIAKFLSTCEAGGVSEEAEAEDTTDSPGDEPAFIIVGTVSANNKEEKLSFLREKYTSPTRDELLQCLLECDVVVYNISEADSQQQIEEATWALTALQAEMENFESQKVFILVSTVMTWAMTKPQNPDETDVLFSEEGYIRRRPHLSFRNHHNLEKLVLKLKGGKKSKLRGYVVGSGHQYGKGENLFHFFFKVSWLMQLPEVPIFGQGANCIPMIHVNDLGGVIQNIIEVKPKIKSKYILAVDDSKNTLKDIVTMISETLGPGKINVLPEDEAIAMKAFTPEELQFLSLNLRLDAFIIRDSFSLRWTSEGGMVENIKNVIKEFKDSRQLLPIRICLVGPPAVGKTTLAEKLCSHYRIHHIKIKQVMEEKLKQLEEKVNGAEHEDEEVAAAQKQLDTLRKSMEMNEDRLADQLVSDTLREKLLSNPCRNQGFVLDGFPKTYEEAKLVFTEEVTEDQDSVTRAPVYDKEITPEHVFVLNASDGFLTKRAQEVPQREAEEKQYTQEEFTARLKRYRELSAAEETLLDYFDDIEIHPEHIEITAGDPEYTAAMKRMTQIVGVPKNFGLSPEEQEEEDRKKEEVRRQKLAAEAAEKKHRKEAALAEMAAQYKEWQKNLCELKRQEQELLEARCLPLRNYLMKYVMPSLTEAMLACSKIKPDDPVDFLAEHLLRNNHQEQK